MQEVYNRFAICIPRGKSVLYESCVNPRECAKHTWALALGQDIPQEGGIDPYTA